MIGVIALATIGAINIYSIKRWGRTGSAILATRVVTRTNFLGPVGSASVTRLVFGVGFDTATQISALTLSAIASATLGVQIALMLAVFLSWV
jgi:nickel/cobalt transporter (NiCoT) family protein